MKWIFELLNKPGARRSAQTNVSIAQAAKPAEDIELLRDALAVAVDSWEQIQLAARLGRALAEHLQSPLAGDPPEVWVAAICNVPDKALAQAWSMGLKGDAWLGEVAKQARMAEVRFAAAQRIETSAVLEQVAHASRDRDRRVYRHCADLLRHRQQAKSSAGRALEIASELRALLDTAPLPNTRLLNLKKELSALGEAAEPSSECSLLMQEALGRLQQESEARRDLQALQATAVAQASECACAAWPWSGQIEGWRTRLESLRPSLAGLPPWLAGQAGARALGKSLGEIESGLAALAVDDERILVCEQFLAGMDASMPANAEMAAAWAVLAKPDHPDARQSIESRWQALNDSLPPVSASEAVPQPPPAPGPQTRIDHAAVRGLLDKLEQAMGQGHLAEANAMAKQIKATLGDNILHGALGSRLHGLQAQLEALRGWARWGTGQAREKLIAAAGELLNGERDMEELARAISALRDEWKRLNVHGAATKTQWESFDTMLESAYQPVAVHRAEEAARQAAARIARQALCEAWEAEVAGIVWEHADFKVVEARRTEMLRQWRSALPAGFRDQRGLRKRFDAVVGDIDMHLDAARATECERREQLIAAAQALQAQPDLGRAMTEAKALQARWNQQPIPVRLKPTDEEKLWQRLRTACNAVFERRAAQRAEQEAQRQEQAQSRQLLLDAFAATLSATDGDGMERALARFRAEWGATRKAAHDHADGGMEARANELQQQAQQRLEELRKDKYRERLELLAQRAALAEKVEAAVLDGGPIEAVVAEAEQAWNTLPPLPGNAGSVLAQRFAKASAITRADLAAGRETREALLLDLEITLGLPSPEAYAAARRQRQLERLQNRFGAASAQGEEPEVLLARCYATAAPADASFDRRVGVIVRQLAKQAAPARAASVHR